MKIGNLDIISFKLGGADCSIYLGDIKLYPEDSPTPEPTPTLQWVSYSIGDSVPSDRIYGVRVDENVEVEDGYPIDFATDTVIGPDTQSIYIYKDSGVWYDNDGNELEYDDGYYVYIFPSGKEFYCIDSEIPFDCELYQE